MFAIARMEAFNQRVYYSASEGKSLGVPFAWTDNTAKAYGFLTNDAALHFIGKHFSSQLGDFQVVPI